MSNFWQRIGEANAERLRAEYAADPSQFTTPSSWQQLQGAGIELPVGTQIALEQHHASEDQDARYLQVATLGVLGAAAFVPDLFATAAATDVGAAGDVAFGDVAGVDEVFDYYPDVSEAFSPDPVTDYEVGAMDDFMDISDNDYVGDLPLDDGGDVYNAMQVSPGIIQQGVGAAMSLGRALMSRAGVAAGAGAGAAARGLGKFAINGVTGSVRSLWPAIKRYGPTAVATALGVSVPALLEMAMAADPSMGTRRPRRRGISARDIRTTKRVVGFVSRISHQIGCVRAPRHFRKRSH